MWDITEEEDEDGEEKEVNNFFLHWNVCTPHLPLTNMFTTTKFTS